MARITVLGGTGYAGSNNAREAASRGHQVKVVARKAPAEPIEGVTYVEGSVLDDSFLADAVKDADVIAESLSPRGDLVGKLEDVVKKVMALAETNGSRLGVVGGAATLQLTPGGPTLLEQGGIPDFMKPEVTTLADVLADLRASDPKLDWFFLSPAGNFGAHNPGERTGKFRVGGDVLLTDDKGESNISGADLAIAFVDEIDHPAHHRERFTVAY
jgi:putative NADH-flavin reductase